MAVVWCRYIGRALQRLSGIGACIADSAARPRLQATLREVRAVATAVSGGRTVMDTYMY